MNLEMKNTCSLALGVMLFYIFAIKLVLVLNDGPCLEQDHHNVVLNSLRPRPGLEANISGVSLLLVVMYFMFIV